MLLRCCYLCLHSQCFAGAKQDPSNQKFADDIRGWYNLTKRLYIWDYTTVSLHARAQTAYWYAVASLHAVLALVLLVLLLVLLLALVLLVLLLVLALVLMPVLTACSPSRISATT